tara:strand:- start:240 stop:680 length:441 start_codon:yes stop_codon:yes gene_type:complete
LIKKELLAKRNFELYQSCVETGTSQFSLTDFVRFENLINIDVINNKSALAVISLIKDELEIYFIGIKKNNRNQGLGKQFLCDIIKLAKDKGATSIVLEVSEKNKIALNMYKSLNFEGCGTRKNYYYNPDGKREDALIMRLKLNTVT